MRLESECRPFKRQKARASICGVFIIDNSGIFAIFAPEKRLQVHSPFPKSVRAALEALIKEPVEAGKLALRNRAEAHLRYKRYADLRALYAVLSWRNHA